MLNQILQFIALFLLLQACASGILNFSKRDIGGFPKPGPMQGQKRDIESDETEQKYVKRQTLKIESDPDYLTTGSLFGRRGNSSFLIEDVLPVKKGQYINVKLVSANESATKNATSPAQGGAADPNAPTPSAPKDDDLKKIFDTLPTLDPGGQREGLLSSLEFEVQDISEDGWATVSFRKTSQNERDKKEIYVSARLSADDLKDLKSVNSRHLRDVKYFSVEPKNRFEKESQIWTDELTARVSGFTEVQSNYSQSLEEKKKEIQKIRKDVDNKLNLVSRERSLNAVNRDKLRADRQALDDKISTLEKTVQDQQDEIAKLTPVDPASVAGGETSNNKLGAKPQEAATKNEVAK